jgi:hypothetical protein
VLEGYRLLIHSYCHCRGGGGEVGVNQLLGRSKGEAERFTFLV